jgi:UDP-glucose 4-epimerase
MEQVLASGSAGFIGGYIAADLLNHGYAVIDLGNFSKYWKVKKSYDDNPRYGPVEGDAKTRTASVLVGYRVLGDLR